VLVFTLSACSGSAPSATESGDSSIQAIQQVLFGSSELRTESNATQLQDEALAFEERVVRCMALAGFEYTSETVDVQVYSAEDVDYMSREYAETNGFGYTTSLGQPFDQAQAYVDPNADYLASLSEAEQEEFYTTLYGDQSYWDEVNSDEELAALQEEQPELFEPSGCYNDASSSTAQASQAFWSTHSDELQELNELAEDSSHVQQPLADWSRCMAEHGHNFTTPDDLDSVMDPYMNDLYATASHPSQDLTEDEMMALSEEEMNELWSQPEQFDPDLLAEAQEYEIELAVTAWDCGMTDLYASYQTALDELQQQFITSNLDELQALVAQ